MAAMVLTTWLDGMDEKAGDGLEAVLRSHHRRRLDRLGWSEALSPREGGSWWATRAPVRSGNHVEVLVDGTEALAAMEAAIRAARTSVHIAGWHASPDFALTRGPGALPLRDLLADVARRVPVRVLLWAGPPLPLFQPTRTAVHRARDEFVRDSRVQCALDRRERTMHCHHEKIVVIDGTTAFVGGIDLTALQGDRHDASAHPPRTSLGWHDAAVHLQGPAVLDVAVHFTRRWHEVTGEQLAPPVEPPAAGDLDVQVLRTVPEKTYRFAPRGEFTILEAYVRALRSAERFIYLENQFLWSPEVVDVLADKLARPPCEDFRVLLVLPAKPSNGADTTRGQLGRLLDADAGAGRLLATTITRAPRRAVGAGLRARQGGRRGRPVAHHRLGEPQRALVVQRHRDERPRVRPCAGAADAAAALVRAHRAPGARGRGGARRRHRHGVAADGAGAGTAEPGGAAAHAPAGVAAERVPTGRPAPGTGARAAGGRVGRAASSAARGALAAVGELGDQLLGLLLVLGLARLAARDL